MGEKKEGKVARGWEWKKRSGRSWKKGRGDGKMRGWKGTVKERKGRRRADTEGDKEDKIKIRKECSDMK